MASNDRDVGSHWLARKWEIKLFEWIELSRGANMT